MSVSSNRRYLSLWLRRLSTDRIERRSPEQGEAVVVVASIAGAQRITALTDGAARLGLKTGMGLADARAMYPKLPVVEADFEADHRLLVAVADWCDRYTPLVGLDPPDGLFLDVAGCAHLFGGEAALARDLLTRLAGQGFRARVAVADTPGGAWGLARHGAFLSRQRCSAPLPPRSEAERWGGVGGGGQLSSQFPPPRLASLADPPHHALRAREEGGPWHRCDSDEKFIIVPRGETPAAVLPLPIAALRVGADIVADLKTAGLARVADLASRPRAPFAARFGKGLLLRLDQALGDAEESITPRLPIPAAMAEQRFPDPIARESDVLGTIEHLGRQLVVVLERRGEGGRLFQAALFRADGAVHRLELGTGTPLRDPARIRKLFEERLAVLGDACDPGFGYDMVRLSALATERSDPAQTGLAGDDHQDELDHLINRFGARFGLRRVTRLVPQDTHIPEYAVMSVPAHVPTPPHRSASLRGGRGETAAAVREQTLADQDSFSAVRPLRLFTRPERIDAIAQVPDGPPIQFSWRHITHQVAQVEGPERIAMEWWRDHRGNQLTRDYFRVESHAGARMWVYREGLYDREVDLPQVPQWYLHGLFA